jgi:hypothetical protein
VESGHACRHRTMSACARSLACTTRTQTPRQRGAEACCRARQAVHRCCKHY